MSAKYQAHDVFSMKIPVSDNTGEYAPQAYSSTAPEVYYEATAPEVHYSETAPEVYYPETAYVEAKLDQEAQTENSSTSSLSSTICGLKRRTFWVALLVLIVVIIAAVGGGIGGSLANKKTSSVSSQSETSDDSSTPTSTTDTSTADDSGVVVLEATGVSATSTTTSTATSTAQPMADSNYAAVNWNETVGILYQDTNANIRMVEFNFTLESGNTLNYTWSKPTDPLMTSRSIRKGTPISAIAYNKGTARRELRVYLINTDNIIEEWAWNNVASKWAGNVIYANVTTSETSQVTAKVVSTSGSLKIFVFYQDTNNRLAGMVYVSGSGWKAVTEFSDTEATDWPLLNSKGSGLSVVTYPATAPKGIRVYYEDTDTKLNWIQGTNIDLATSKQSWKNGTQLETLPSEVPLSAIVVPTLSDRMLQLFYIKDSKVVVDTFSKQSWKNGTQLETLPSEVPLSAIVVPTLSDRMLQLFYIKDSKVVVDTFNTSGIATSTGVNDNLGYLPSAGLTASSTSLAAVTWDEMVMVLTGAKEWFNIWQYTPSNSQWNNPSVPTGYFLA